MAKKSDWKLKMYMPKDSFRVIQYSSTIVNFFVYETTDHLTFLYLVVVWFVGEEFRAHVVGCPYQCRGHITGAVQHPANRASHEYSCHNQLLYHFISQSCYLAIPRSPTLMILLFVRKIFCVFKSLCKMFLSCMYWNRKNSFKYIRWLLIIRLMKTYALIKNDSLYNHFICIKLK